VLLDRKYRVPYKVSKSSRYWKDTTVAARIINLLAEFYQIERGLARVFGETHIPLPTPGEVTTLSSLKRYEDGLDALVSAWVGIRFVGGTATAYGDANAAIWAPVRG
jgi:hypothetical protein